MSITEAAGLGVGAAVLSLCANALLGGVARRHNWCDAVSAEQTFSGARLKIHDRAVPFTGGMGIWAAVAVVVAVPLSVISRQQSAIGHQLLIVGCGAVALLLGTWDDFHWKLRSTAGPKFLAQALAAMVMAFGLSRVGVVPGSPVLAAALVIGAMNALNLEDGMDGVASGEALASALGFAFWLLGTGPAWAGGVALALAGALAGMLVLNWHPARVFLGDGGSHLVGALLGALAAVVVSTHGIRALGPAVLIIGLPVADTAWVIVQRLVTGRRIGAGDRSHVYDLLHRAGLSVRQTAVVCWAAQAVLVSAGLRLGCT